jgi:hypothetical protein
MNFYLQHGKAGEPMWTESVEARESWMRRPTRRRTVVPCRFVVKHNSRWHRLYSDSAQAVTHFINTRDGRIAVTGVCP